MKKTITQHHRYKKSHPKSIQQKNSKNKPQIFILFCFFIFLLAILFIMRGLFINGKKTESVTNQKQYYFGVGVGITFRDGRAIVSRVIPGTPAEKAGVMLNDIIIAVDSVPINTENSRNLCREIRGQEGDMVNLSIERQKETFDKKLMRTKIYSRTPTTCQ